MSAVVRAAIRLHPVAWRERYAAEVLGTLQDIADERHGGRVPLSESVPLGFRGLWLRARFSLTFWAGLVIIALFIASAVTADVLYVDGSLIAVSLELNTGLGYALPVLALAAGWAGVRARTVGGAGAPQRLRQLGSDTWPLAAFTTVGYVTALIMIAIRAGLSWGSGPALFVILAQWAMVLVAIATGQLLGAVLPRMVVIFAAPIAIGVVALLLFIWQTPWNVAPQGFYRGIAYVFDIEPYKRVLVIAGILAATSALVVAARPVWARIVPVAVLITFGAVVAAQPVQPHVDAAALQRPLAELVCSTVEPVICLWPEQEAAFGSSLRDQMAAVYATASTLDLPVDSPAPRSVAQYAMTGIPHPDGNWDDLSLMGLGTDGFGPGDLIPLYAYTLPSCCWEEPETGDGEYSAVAYATSIVLGVPPENALPAVVDPYTGQRNFDPKNVPTLAAARTLVDEWVSEGVNGVRSPD